MIILTVLTILNTLLIGFLLYIIRSNNLLIAYRIRDNHKICCERTEYNHRDIEQIQDQVQSIDAKIENITMQIPNYDPQYFLKNIIKH